MISVEQAPTAGLRARADGGLEVGVWSGSPPAWQSALWVDGDNGHVGIGIDPMDAFAQLAVGRDIQAKSASLEELFVNEVQTAKVVLLAHTLPIIQAGATDPATTPWEQYDVNCVAVVVDTSSAGFTETPLYFASLGGNSSHFLVTGVNAIYSPTPTSFKLFIRTPSIRAADWSLSIGFVRDRLWHINWLGIVVR